MKTKPLKLEMSGLGFASAGLHFVFPWFFKNKGLFETFGLKWLKPLRVTSVLQRPLCVPSLLTFLPTPLCGWPAWFVVSVPKIFTRPPPLNGGRGCCAAPPALCDIALVVTYQCLRCVFCPIVTVDRLQKNKRLPRVGDWWGIVLSCQLWSAVFMVVCSFHESCYDVLPYLRCKVKAQWLLVLLMFWQHQFEPLVTCCLVCFIAASQTLKTM